LGTGGILEVIWYGLRFENVKLFGSHFAAWLIGLITVIWFVTALVYALKQYRAEKDKWEKQQVKLKYLKR
jgi:type VI protein secretion system component VasK